MRYKIFEIEPDLINSPQYSDHFLRATIIFKMFTNDIILNTDI